MTDIVPVRHLPAATSIAERSARIGNPTLAAVQENYMGKSPEKDNKPQLDLGPDLKPCKCVGVLPGRACTLCGGTKWLRRCAGCHGSGLIFKNGRTSASQAYSERHGMCGGVGWLGARLGDVREAIKDAELAAADAKKVDTKPEPQRMDNTIKKPKQS